LVRTVSWSPERTNVVYSQPIGLLPRWTRKVMSLLGAARACGSLFGAAKACGANGSVRAPAPSIASVWRRLGTSVDADAIDRSVTRTLLSLKALSP
jgi:hypothetical protein